ncbi:MAG: hypothetical protein AAF797_02545 [Planctomycetota bacterium]
MNSNLTAAGWALLLTTLIVICGGWYLATFVFEIGVNAFGFFVGGGTGLVGGGAVLLNRMGIDIIK